MNSIRQHFGRLAILACLGSAWPVFADDTEIYTGDVSSAAGIKPNVVFIIDTSGSMNTDETVETGTYNPATTYTGSCNASRVFWSTSGNAPACDTNQYIETTSNACGASAAGLGSGGTGFYSARAARYKAGSSRRRGGGEDTWDTLSDNDHDDLVDCEDDWGIHGQTTADTAKYPADENDGGPWRADSTGAITWSRTGGNYTFYNANYLNWRETGGGATTKTRLQIVKEVFSGLLDSVSGINVAVMRFDQGSGSTSGSNGGYFIAAMQELNDTTRAGYQTAVNALTASGWTPLAETLYESYLYYKGAAVEFGDSSRPATNVAGVLSGSNYESPIDYQCQKNFVVLLTDGDPTYDTNADSMITGMAGFSALTGAASCTGNCLDELAQYMNGKDCSSFDGTQNVITYTIGFTTAQTLLNNAATKGGGKYFTANDTTDLTDALTSIINEIRDTNDSFIAPAVSVNSFNRFTHRDELYYALFRPDIRPRWDGNIKRYKLAGDPPEIVDKNAAAAINDNTGFFKSTATSYWTADADAPDGEIVRNGGAAGMLTNNRTVYTYVGATTPTNVTLTSAGHNLHESNALITKTLLGDAAMSDTDRSNLLQWARGVDILDEDSDTDETDARRRIGDPLHAKPVLVTYGGTEAEPDITLFAGTNEGYLHAINTTTGAEMFSFIPKELLPNLSLLFENVSTTNHPYGLDGPLSVWFNDVNKNGLLLGGGGATDSGEHVYLYQAMRRGGNNYYALDVSNRAAPVLKWVIYGGSADFSELGQSWSRATVAKIKLDSVEKTVLIFGGGYDTNQDSNATAEDDSIGRAIYMVDAATGAKIWQAGPANSNNGADPDLVLTAMTNSIPAEVTVIDSDFDGYADLLYVGDMRAQLWRFDIHNRTNTGASTLVTGGVIARLGGSAGADNRRFYYRPDVSLTRDGKKWNIAIGSGYREHPLNTTIHDAMFVIQDLNVYSPELDSDGHPVYTVITMADLFDASNNIIGEGSVAQIDVARTSLLDSKGFYIYMAEQDGSFVGEKVLAKSVTLESKLVFTTYTPVNTASSSCAPGTGTARTYYINIADGTPVIDANSSGGDPTWPDRRIDLTRGGIPPEPSVIFHQNGPVVLIGTEKGPGANHLLKPIKTFWREE